MASDTVRRVVEVDSQVIMTEYTILREYEDVFTGLEKLPRKHHIHFDKTVKLVLHAPRKVQVASRDNVETELTRLENGSVLAKVTEPTPWVSSLMIVPTTHGQLRICIDPSHLNKAIQREHYPSKTVEEVATR